VVRAAAIAILTAVACPTAAQDIYENEDLVMRLIFDDCLGFVADDRPPFSGLNLFALAPEVEATLPEAAEPPPGPFRALLCDLGRG
jgi:hypothetical protein